MTFVVTEKRLKAISPFATNPKTYITHDTVEGDHTFRVMSDDDKPLYTIRVDMDADGNAARVWSYVQYLNRNKEYACP